MKTHAEFEGDITLNKMDVIARNRFVFGTLQQVLTSENIPFAIKKVERYAEAESIFGRVLDYALRLKLNPKDWIDGKKLCALLNVATPANWGDEDLLNQLALAVSQSGGFLSDVISQLLGAIAQLNNDAPNIRKLVEQFKNKLTAIAKNGATDEQKNELAQSLADLDEFGSSWLRHRKKGFGESLASFRNAAALGKLADDVPENGLTLSTVHTMKGLEKDIVFLMGMCEGLFPDYRAKTTAAIDEERNSAFVAVTRAKRWLYVSYPKIRRMPWGDDRTQQPSQFYRQMQ
jgi:DNA helicase-2/ATP-dependent DNA helicase PcrA